MAYGYPYQQIPNYFNTNYSVNPTIATVPDEQTARNAQFPMDGSAAYFANANGQEIYSKQLSMANGSVIFHRFKREEQKQDSPYVTREEMTAKFDELYQLIGQATAPEVKA